MSIKNKIFEVIESNRHVLSIALKITNKMQCNDKNINIASIHFRSNEVYISKIAGNQVTLEENSYMQSGKVWIKGAKNYVEIKKDTVIAENKEKQMIHIDGDNNQIIIGQNCRINDTTLFVWGNNNKIVIDDNCSLMKVELHIEQNNNTIKIGKGCTFHGRDGYPIHIAVDEGSQVVIDEDCMFANGIQVRSTDSHSILNLEGKRINPAKDIYIGKHCWLGLGTIILKGTNILPHTVIAAGGVCSKKYEERNCILAGNPARVVKKGIDWDRKFI